MRPALRTAILALAVLVGTAAPAGAASSATTIHLPQGHNVAVGGPVFAGGAVAFGRPTSDGYEVVIRRGAHAAISRVSIAGLKGAYQRSVGGHLEASDRRLILSLGASVCDNRTQCETPDARRTVYSAVLTGDLDGGKLTRVAGCTSEAGCAARPKCRPGGGDVSGDVVAYYGCPDGVHVRDLTPGASPAARDYASPAKWPRLADPYVAYVNGGDDFTSNVVVTNWRTGADAYSVSANQTDSFDLQSDGKLVYELRPDAAQWASQRAWASPAEPFAHEWSNDATFFTKDLRIADDLLAYETYGSGDLGNPGDELGSLIRVHDLSAAPPPNSETDPGYRGGGGGGSVISLMDFDGTRLTWIDRVCRRSWLVVSTLGEPQPQHPTGPCPIPRVVQGSARVDASQRLHVTLQCPAEPPVGCLGFVVTDREPGHVSHAYSIPAGERRTKRLGSEGLCRGPDGRVRVKIDFIDEYDEYIRAVRTVTVHGATAQLRRC